MTNDEIEKRAQAVVDDQSWDEDYEVVDYNKLRELIATAIREAVAQAYEEAAKVAEVHVSAECGDEALPAEIAEAIRALKDNPRTKHFHMCPLVEGESGPACVCDELIVRGHVN